jgi:hypothetical protein
LWLAVIVVAREVYEPAAGQRPAIAKPRWARPVQHGSAAHRAWPGTRYRVATHGDPAHRDKRLGQVFVHDF